MSFCRGCGQDFSSARAFDRHRVGVHAYLFSEGMAMDPPREDGRRCLDTAELRDTGYRQNGKGRWEVIAHADRARVAFPTRRKGQS